jgi:hypothetical protein
MATFPAFLKNSLRDAFIFLFIMLTPRVLLRSESRNACGREIESSGSRMSSNAFRRKILHQCFLARLLTDPRILADAWSDPRYDQSGAAGAWASDGPCWTRTPAGHRACGSAASR